MVDEYDQNAYMDWAISQCPWIETPKDPLTLLIEAEEADD
jgi:hypothetical protein